MTSAPPATPHTAVITIVAGRHEHLRRQQHWLARSSMPPDAYTCVVVAMGDPTVDAVLANRRPAATVVHVPANGPELPLARARNAGARAALDLGAALLVFLDVDCIPLPGLLERYRDAAAAHPDALLGGAVGYLPPDADFAHPETLADTATFHAFRPRLPDGAVGPAEHRVFWSLSFAVTAATWQHIGGFCEDFEGYGAEDTDFAMLARAAGTRFVWVGGAEALHQYHPTTDPPVQHLDAILKNGARFASRWGEWPMQGWLDRFAELGLIERDDATGGWRRRPSGPRAAASPTVPQTPLEGDRWR